MKEQMAEYPTALQRVPVHPDAYDDEPRTNTTVRRYPPQQTIIQARYWDLRGNPIPQRSHRNTEDHIPATPATRAPLPLPAPALARRRRHPLVYISGTVAVMAFGYLSFSVVGHWWTGVQDDWHYGTPRTFQIDARVGHGDSQTPSHFIAQNEHGHFYVIEVAGGDPSHTQIYVVGPTLQGDGADRVPITISFEDVNHDGKPDMVVQINDTHYVYINDTIDGKDTFRPAKPEDQVNV